MDSILTSIKKMLGIEADDTDFDTDIIIHINSALMDLQQIGVGPADGYIVQNEMDTWEAFLGYAYNAESVTKMEGAKTCVYLKVRLLFDPPESSAHMEALKQQIDRLEWRLSVQAESVKKEV